MGKFKSAASGAGRFTLDLLDLFAEASSNAPLHIEADTVSSLIKQARLERDMSSQNLANAIGVSRWTVASWEDEIAYLKPSFDNLIDIKRVLNIDAESVKKFL